ncbi:p-Nitrophenyl phosphatase [Suhomyces tanzawaensis NRRL Y-17324]|uniref:4-nitrophenylphosphatase n=1 Tax=Suhomyces tanzawaensis NRRL Y-17324 TaxID=984487 RepID=A0A1E4SE06_9ASCO|nr:p-Nitrophenyl phosphatase [Suhomyces tanzawaensis NRRL Y-17324]ODV77754.1 p-Nitrophenyl phosphatase [Suhomyces tanzawaensis NRRL Y-17324]
MTISSSPIKITAREHVQALLDQYDNFLFDCDGVVWLGETLIPGMVEAIEYLESKGKKVVFVTNNSSKSRDEYVEKFHRLGFKSFRKQQVYPTCYAAVSNLDQLGVQPGAKVWVLGDAGIMHELKEGGYQALGGTDTRLNQAFDPDHPLLEVDPEVQAVIVGSTKDFNYMRIALTLQYLLHNNKSIPFIGANIDRTYPGPHGLILPAGGSVVSYMEYTANRTFLNVGKPSTQFLDTIVAENGFDRSRTLMVGDTLYTDIKFGNDGKLGAGAGSLLVLTGGTKPEDLAHLLHLPEDYEDPHSMTPLYVMDSFGAFVDILKG